MMIKYVLPKYPYKQIAKRVVKVGLGALSVLTLIGLVWMHRLEASLPDVSNITALRADPVTRILSEDGVVLASFEPQHRKPVELDRIAPVLIQATIATEDARFYEHSGVDPRGIARAFFSNLRNGNAEGQGGSTLTQQLARNLYLSDEKTFTRKIKEALLARRIEQRYSKAQILDAYLNTVYYGNGCYGIETASETYFGKHASALTLGEAALLAGIPQRPSALEPLQHRSAAMARRRVVLARMVATGKITAAQEAQALAQPLALLTRPLTMVAWKAPYFVQHVVSELRDLYGGEFLFSGAQVETTLDWRMQQAAEQALLAQMRRHSGPNTGAIVSLDPHTGAVRALVGGPDFRQDQFDAATQGIRQPGSAFKPLLYATAIEDQLCNLATLYSDEPVTFGEKRHIWTVHNENHRYLGEISVLQAIRDSVNTVAVQVGQQAGLSNVVAVAHQMGINTPLEASPALALGASGVHPIDLCSAYSAFANGGERYDPYFIRSITNAGGKQIFQDDMPSRHHDALFTQDTLDQVNVALRDVVDAGTGRRADSIPDAHGKTGTTDSRRDVWFAGYTGELATVVWVAHVERHTFRLANGSIATNYHYLPMRGATGGRLCAPIWAEFMRAALPIQRHTDAAYGVTTGPIPGPTLAALMTQLKADNQQNDQPPAADPNTPDATTNAPDATTDAPSSADQGNGMVPMQMAPASSGVSDPSPASPEPAADRPTGQTLFP